MRQAEIIYENTESLVPYINNPRINDGAVDAVAKSIKQFGFKIPIIISTSKEIIAGHTRLKAAKKLGLKEVPCIIADNLTDEQIRAFRLVDNRAGEFAEWDYSALQEELKTLKGDSRKEIEEMFGMKFEQKERNDSKRNRYLILDDEEYEVICELIDEIVPTGLEEYILQGIEYELRN